jgi:predicted RNase H-like HicB family nuclease
MAFHVEFDREEDGRWIAEIPELPGVLAYGATQEEAEAKVDVLALTVVTDKLKAKELEAASVPQRPHYPARHDQSAHKHGEAVQGITDLVAGGFALRDSENY